MDRRSPAAPGRQERTLERALLQGQCTEFELRAPRLAPLSDEQREEAVGLLAELLVDAARKREGVDFGSGFPGVLGGASGGVASLPDEGVSVRRAA